MNEGMEMFMANYWDWKDYNESLAGAVEDIAIKYKVKPQKAMEDLSAFLPSEEEMEALEEGYYEMRPIDRERYTDMSHEGLEGPFQTKSGKVVYYDPKEGRYYDRDSDMYLTHEEWEALNEELVEGYPDDFNTGAFDDYWGDEEDDSYIDDAMWEVDQKLKGVTDWRQYYTRYLKIPNINRDYAMRTAKKRATDAGNV